MNMARAAAWMAIAACGCLDTGDDAAERVSAMTPPAESPTEACVNGRVQVAG